MNPNRVAHKKYPTLSVVLQDKQNYELTGKETQVSVIGMCPFSWYCDGKSDDIQIVYEKTYPVNPIGSIWKSGNKVSQVSLLAMYGVTIDPNKWCNTLL